MAPSPRNPDTATTPRGDELSRRDAALAWTSAAIFFLALAAANALRIASPGEAGDLEYLETILFGALFFVVWVALIGRLWPAVLLAFLLFAWWWPAELYLRLNYHAPMAPQFVGMALETSAAEFQEFLLTFRSELAWGAALVALAALPALLLCRRYPARWRHRSRWWCLLVFPAAAGASYAAYELQEPAWLGSTNDAFRVEPLAFWSDKWRSVFPMTLPLALKRYRDDAARVAQLRGQIEGFRFGATSTRAPLDAVVLVIGESARADRWSLNGYGRKTNPLLEKRVNLVFFSNVVTQSAATRYAVPFIVARSPVLRPDGKGNTRAEPSLIAAFNEAGYRSTWLSNQSASGFWDTSSAFYARDAATSRFLNPSSSLHQGSYDEVLLPPVAALLAQARPTLVVLHTLGSHFNYAYRYPPAFDRFKPSLRASGGAPADPAARTLETNNAYDNTILYTDHVLDKLMEQLNAGGRRSLLAYVSDHGEDVFDPGCPAPGVTRHGRWTYRVPALLWMSDALARERKPELELLRLRSGQALQSDAVFQTLVELAGVDVPARAGDPSPASVLATRPARAARMVVGADGHWTDFDKAEKRDACRIHGE